jgi:hypothetical protein
MNGIDGIHNGPLPVLVGQWRSSLRVFNQYIEREGSLLYMGEDYPINGNLGGIYEIYYYEYEGV